VTHDQEEALTMSDRIAVMNKGRIEQLGVPVEIYERPVTRYVADFIGETNFLEGRITSIHPDWTEVSLQDAAAVRAPTIEGLSEGQSITIAIRPEKISVGAPDAAPPDRIPGRVEEVVYIGTDTRYIVRLPNGMNVVSRVQNLGQGAVIHYTPGTEVALIWEPSTARILTE
jgi:spermidine/putrescine transport system ATP-binding protein